MKESFDKDNKVGILLSALEERYTSIHTIRERVQSIGIWSLGILLGAGGWLTESGTILSGFEKFLYLVAVLIAFIVLRFYYLKDLHRGFKNQQRIAARLEKALGLFTPKLFDDLEASVYPKEWENAGTDGGKGNFFHTNYATFIHWRNFFGNSDSFEWLSVVNVKSYRDKLAS